LRWLYNTKKYSQEVLQQTEWITPPFAKIKEKGTKPISPYSETELWERDEILSIIKYEPFKRNKAALTLFWDLNARNHEVTLLKIKHISLRERYGEGEIPHEAKTGTGPILLTCSFPYVRDWLNEHPFRNEPDARLICNLITGRPVKPEAMWTMTFFVSAAGKTGATLPSGFWRSRPPTFRSEIPYTKISSRCDTFLIAFRMTPGVW
jgi:hypothetical protein